VKGRVGGMESIQARYGIPVNCYSYYKETNDFPKEFAMNWAIHKLIRSLSEGKFGEFRKTDLFKYTNPHNKRDFVDSRDFYIHCFRGIQGVSEVIAERIVDTLGIESFEDLTISLNYESMKAVNKIGPTIARRILEHWNVII
jgi:ERCC4-type nuclease